MLCMAIAHGPSVAPPWPWISRCALRPAAWIGPFFVAKSAHGVANPGKISATAMCFWGHLSEGELNIVSFWESNMAMENPQYNHEPYFLIGFVSCHVWWLDAWCPYTLFAIRIRYSIYSYMDVNGDMVVYYPNRFMLFSKCMTCWKWMMTGPVASGAGF